MGPNKLAMSIIAAAIALGVGPADAAITTFADYKAIGTGSNIYWKNNGTSSSNGTGGSIYTLSSPSATTPGTTKISFSFLQPELAPYFTNVVANFTLLATVTNAPALTVGGFKIQPSIVGSFSIKTTNAITIGSTTYAVGANLLTGVFTGGSVFGQNAGTSGSVSGSTTGGAAITYTSDFLSFAPTRDRDFSLSLTSIASPLASSSGKALRSFRAVSTGSFSTDPAPTPLIGGVPESATWAMFIGGFGLMGASLRRRRPENALV
jgi:hypothetical protein